MLLAAACGGEPEQPAREAERAAPAPGVQRALNPSSADFPQPRGRPLQALADTVRVGPQMGLATSVFTPGSNRLAFGVIGEDKRFLYGPTAVYIARRPQDPAQGPYPAPAQPLVVEASFRSRGAVEEGDDIAAIYAAEVPLPRPGRYAVLTVTRTAGGLVGAGTQIEVARRSAIPAAGERAPVVETETVRSARGNLRAIETRDPPDRMHEVSLTEVAGKRPVALLFSTPALCESRVCAPVTDIAAQLQEELGDRVTFIHQEVYVANDVRKGLRPPLRAFRLRTEPWLFTLDAEGRVAARLEGSFGIEEFRTAVRAAL